MRRFVCIVLSVVAAWLAAAAALAREPPLARLAGTTMGTDWTVAAVLPALLRADAVQAGVQATLDRVDGQMSTWRADSDLMRYNRAPANTWRTLPPEFFGVLQQALQLAAASDGAYDPTIGPLVDLWGFGPTPATHRVPDAKALAAARTRVGWRRVRLDVAARRAWQPGGVELDLSSIAKGYGVDAVAHWLDGQGVVNYLVEVGGELRARGTKPDGGAWRVAVELPDAAAGRVVAMDEVARVLTLHDEAVATSGDYRHFFEDDGRTWSHHIDPRTGQPVPWRVASVTVIAPETVVADPIGTLLSVLGPQAGMTFARDHHLAVLMQVREGARIVAYRSPAFAARSRP